MLLVALLASIWLVAVLATTLPTRFEGGRRREIVCLLIEFRFNCRVVCSQQKGVHKDHSRVNKNTFLSLIVFSHLALVSPADFRNVIIGNGADGWNTVPADAATEAILDTVMRDFVVICCFCC